MIYRDVKLSLCVFSLNFERACSCSSALAVIEKTTAHWTLLSGVNFYRFVSTDDNRRNFVFAMAKIRQPVIERL